MRGFPVEGGGIREAINLALTYVRANDLVLMYVTNLALTYTGSIIKTEQCGASRHPALPGPLRVNAKLAFSQIFSLQDQNM